MTHPIPVLVSTFLLRLSMLGTALIPAPVLDYAYSHYTGIILVSTAYFAVYCVVKCNKPQIYPKMILPALLSGIMWGVAMCELYRPHTAAPLLDSLLSSVVGWFLANEHLSLAVSFPIVTAVSPSPATPTH